MAIYLRAAAPASATTSSISPADRVAAERRREALADRRSAKRAEQGADDPENGAHYKRIVRCADGRARNGAGDDTCAELDRHGAARRGRQLVRSEFAEGEEGSGRRGVHR